MNIRTQAERPYSYNTRWRLKFNRGRHTTFIGYRNGTVEAHTEPYQLENRPRNRVYFWSQKENFVYDEYDHKYYNDLQVGTLREIPFHEIPAVVISHEIGSGEADCIGNRMVLDAYMDYRHYTGYAYENPDVNAISLNDWRLSWHDPQYIRRDPELILDLRNPTIREVVSYAPATEYNYVDVVARNMAAKGGPNPFETTTQPINNTTRDPGDIPTAREAIALVVPFTKFRRSRVELRTSQKVAVVRNLVWEFTDFDRRTYG